MTLRRVYFVCRQCRLGAHPLDVRLGVTDSTSHQAQRLLCLAGSSWSFDRAAQHLREFCGLSVSDNKIRDVCQRHGAAAAAWQRETQETHDGFCNATGDIEFSTDGTSVNTWEGWREMRLGIFSKRQLDYARWLAEGRSIGSGQVEGACKHVIGRRLKQTGARWRVRCVNRMASLCCLVYSDHWDLYWASS